MKSKEKWCQTKFIVVNDNLMPNNDLKYLSSGSRLIADALCKVYQKALSQYARGLLVDLGCGKAPLFGYYKDYISDVICIDWKSDSNENCYLDYEADLNLGIPLPGNYCDTLLTTDVVEHISNIDFFWNEMTRILKNDGILILGCPFLYPIHEQPFDYARYSRYKLESFCKNNNLSILSLESYGGSPEVILSLIANHLNKLPLIARSYIFLCRLLLKTSLFKKISLRTSEKFPLGYMLVAQKKGL